MKLYDKLIAQFKELGFTVEEGSWIEPVGYKVPTIEYFFDVVKNNMNPRSSIGTKISVHYYFKNNKNKLHSFQIYHSEIKLVETESNMKRLL